MGRRRERKRRVLRERFSSSEEDEVDNLEPEPRTCADLFLGCVGWLLTRLWPVCRPLINLVMWPSRKLGINPPVPLLLTIFYAVYVVGCGGGTSSQPSASRQNFTCGCICEKI